MLNDFFSNKLISWYFKNGRELPWRKTNDPYKIWISEVILQQTRVDQGLPYYLKFTEKYPKLIDLANAPLDEVLKLWQGLGYYSRAQNMHTAAQTIRDRYQGKFPSTYESILSLNGVGRYTAAAISSFAFQLPYPVCDGNVKRCISRIFGIHQPVDRSAGEKQINQLLDDIFPPNRPAEFNQAIMDFGAMVCTKSKPLCEECIFNEQCTAFINNQTNILPVKSKKTKVRTRYFYYLILQEENTLWVHKRGQNDIWRNLYEFPCIETDQTTPPAKLIKTPQWEKLFHESNFHIQHISKKYTHLLSHQKIQAVFMHIDTNKIAFSSNYTQVSSAKFKQLAIPRLIENYIKNHPFF